MNSATSTSTATTITLNEGFFSRRNWLDWLFAAIVAVGGLYALQRYGAFMDVYEKGILMGAIPCTIWLCWFWRPLRGLLLPWPRVAKGASSLGPIRTSRGCSP